EGFSSFEVLAAKGFSDTTISCPPNCAMYGTLPFHVVAEDPTGCGTKMDVTVSGGGNTITLDADATTCAGDSGVVSYTHAYLTLLFSGTTFPLPVAVRVASAWATKIDGQVETSACAGEDGCAVCAGYSAVDGQVLS